MLRWWVGAGIAGPVAAWLAGCAGVASPPVEGGGAPPDGVVCPSGATAQVAPPGQGDRRVLADTEVQGCLDGEGRPVGPHLERWAGGGVAVEGAYAGGVRDGTWTRWHPDGAFHSRTVWVEGRQHGERLEVGKDGRIVRISMEGGVATGIDALDPGSPMPEWTGGQRAEGARYRDHAGATP